MHASRRRREEEFQLRRHRRARTLGRREPRPRTSLKSAPESLPVFDIGGFLHNPQLGYAIILWA